MISRVLCQGIVAGLALAISMATNSTVIGEEAKKRPDAPTGYSWQEIEAVRASILVPKLWHFSKSSSRDALVYRVNKEKQEPFLTGLTINVIRNVQKKTKVRPGIYAAKYIKDYLANSKVVEKPKLDKAGKLQRITCQVVKKIPNLDKEKLFRIRVTTLANDKTGTLYVLIFGSPNDEWEKTYPIGKQLFSPIVLNADF